MKIYVTSDLNFCDGFKTNEFSSEQEWNDFLIEKWNNIVDEDDKVYILGGFGKGKIKTIQNILAKLKGNKILLYNNTVRQFSRRIWEHIGLPAVHFTLFSLDKKIHFCYNENTIINDQDDWLICYGGGSSKPVWSSKGINVSAELWGYCPINIDEVRSIWKRMAEWNNISDTFERSNIEQEKKPVKLKFSNL